MHLNKSHTFARNDKMTAADTSPAPPWKMKRLCIWGELQSHVTTLSYYNFNIKYNHLINPW